MRKISQNYNERVTLILHKQCQQFIFRCKIIQRRSCLRLRICTHSLVDLNFQRRTFYVSRNLLRKKLQRIYRGSQSSYSWFSGKYEWVFQKCTLTLWGWKGNTQGRRFFGNRCSIKLHFASFCSIWFTKHFWSKKNKKKLL